MGVEGDELLDNILKKTDIPNKFDILSIDVDGIDYLIWEKFIEYKPKVVVIEINSSFKPDIVFTEEELGYKNMISRSGGVAIVKIGDTTFNETISLATDLLVPSQIIDGTMNVGIQHLQWVTTNATEKIIITRNGTVVMELMGQGTLDLSGNGGFIDSQEAASDLSVPDPAGCTSLSARRVDISRRSKHTSSFLS